MEQVTPDCGSCAQCGGISLARWAMHFNSTAMGVGRAPISWLSSRGRSAGHVFEMLTVHPVPRAEITFHVSEKDGDVHQCHFAPSASRSPSLASTPRAWASKSNSVKLPLWFASVQERLHRGPRCRGCAARRHSEGGRRRGGSGRGRRAWGVAHGAGFNRGGSPAQPCMVSFLP